VRIANLAQIVNVLQAVALSGSYRSITAQWPCTISCIFQPSAMTEFQPAWSKPVAGCRGGQSPGTV
jgi:alpha-L-arabinofuranosidase